MKRRNFLKLYSLAATGILLRGQPATAGLRSLKGPADPKSRKVALAVATTGLDPAAGHRVFEVAAVEIIDRRVTGRSFHSRFDPEREFDTLAANIYGLTQKELIDMPKFSELLDTLMTFLNGSTVVMHNARFDLAFLGSELERLGRPSGFLDSSRAIDTLSLARDAGLKRCTLPNVCRQLGMPLDGRAPYDCLRSARAIAGVYLALTSVSEKA